MGQLDRHEHVPNDRGLYGHNPHVPGYRLRNRLLLRQFERTFAVRRA